MDDITLRKVQLLQLEMAKEVKRICKVLGINYFLDSGTLLGAVRHKGFIPWDDDLDIGMLRSDYDRFVKEAPALLDKKYFLQTWHSDSNFALPFAKVRLNGTAYIEEAAQFSLAHNGIYVDVFPYDVYPQYTQKSLKFRTDRLVHVAYKTCLLKKSGYKILSRQEGNIYKRTLRLMKYCLVKVVSSIVKREMLIKAYEKLCISHNQEETDYYYEQAGASAYGDWLIPKKCFDSYVMLPFEDDAFQCPKSYDLYLKSVYGNYMELPPEDKRANRHGIIRVTFPEEF